jgi:hypothetical protein
VGVVDEDVGDPNLRDVVEHGNINGAHTCAFGRRVRTATKYLKR